MVAKSVIFSTCALILFLLAISEITSVRGELCERASGTWSGYCDNSGHCDGQCKSWEGAAHGQCHWSGFRRMCFCYFNCPKAENLAQDKLKAKELAQHKINAKKLENDAKKVASTKCRASLKRL